MRVCGSTVGATMRTLPCTGMPWAVRTWAMVPTWMRSSSAAVTSARHSSRPWRTMRNSSVPLPSTAPTVALRALMVPLSGARTWVCCRRCCCTTRVALAAATRALATCSAVWYWVICCSLKAPVACSVRARAALALASWALASASSTFAFAWATSACTLSDAKVASTCPARTTSPTLARTSSRRRPLASLPMLASCQAATLPLALSCTAQGLRCGCTVVTVRAGLGATAWALSAAWEFIEKRPIALMDRARAATE